MVTGDDRGGGVRYLARPPVPVSRPGQQDRHGSPALGVQPRRGVVERDGERRPVAAEAERCRTPIARVRSQFTAASELIDWADDPVIGAIVRSWPARIETPRANALALRPEASFDDIVRAYLDDENEHRS